MGSFPVQACPRPDRGNDPLIHLNITLLFVELIKIVIISIRLYKDIPQEKLVAAFRNLTQSHA